MEVFASVAASLIAAAVLFLVGTYFLRQPRVRVKFERGVARSSEGSTDDTLRFNWDSCLELYNFSPFDALEVIVVFPPALARLRIQKPNFTHVLSTEVLGVQIPITEEFSRQLVKSTPGNRFDELLPPEVRELEVRVSYKNQWGKRFYTRYRRTGDQDVCTYHRLCPRWGAA